MHHMPTQLTNSVKGDLHPASAERSNGSLRSNCWELVCQSVGNGLYKIQCVKMNFSPWLHPYNGKHADIFSMEDSLVIMGLIRFFSCQSSTLLQELTFVPKQSRTKSWLCKGGRQHSKNTSRPIRTSSSLLWTIIFRRTVILSFSSTRGTKMSIPNGMRNCGMRFTPRFDPISVILINVPKPITLSLN